MKNSNINFFGYFLLYICFYNSFSKLVNDPKDFSNKNSINQHQKEIQKIENNTIFLSCSIISRHFIKSIRTDIENTINTIEISQEKIYQKIFLLLFEHCKSNLKFEDTIEIIESLRDNVPIDLRSFRDLMNVDIPYQVLFDAFELNDHEINILMEIENFEKKIRNKNKLIEKKKKYYLELLEETKNNYISNFPFNLLNEGFFKICYVCFIFVIISGCFILLFTGFSLSGLKNLDITEEDENNEEKNEEINQDPRSTRKN